MWPAVLKRKPEWLSLNANTALRFNSLLSASLDDRETARDRVASWFLFLAWWYINQCSCIQEWYRSFYLMTDLHMIMRRLVRASDLWHITLYTVSRWSEQFRCKIPQIRKEEKIYTAFFDLSNIPKSNSLVEKNSCLVSGKDFWTDAFFNSFFKILIIFYPNT